MSTATGMSDKEQLRDRLYQENSERIERLAQLHDKMREYKRAHWLSYYWDKFLALILNYETLIAHEYEAHYLYYEANEVSRLIGQLNQQIAIERMMAGGANGVT